METLFIIALTIPAATVAAGMSINKEQQFHNRLLFSLIIAIEVGIMHYLGMLLGGSFMHLLSDYQKAVVLVLSFAIMFRMLTDTLAIKKGQKIFLSTKIKTILLLGLATGINPFIAGLFHEFFPLGNDLAPLWIASSAFIWGLLSASIKFTPVKLIANSLLNLIGCIIILICGIIYVI